MKYLVETSGDFMLLDLSMGAEIPEYRPSIVVPTNFVQGAAARGQLKILRNDLPEAANDAEFAAYWAENAEIAIEAYLSKFSADAILIEEDEGKSPVNTEEAGEKAPKPRRKRGE